MMQKHLQDVMKAELKAPDLVCTYCKQTYTTLEALALQNAQGMFECKDCRVELTRNDSKKDSAQKDLAK